MNGTRVERIQGGNRVENRMREETTFFESIPVFSLILRTRKPHTPKTKYVIKVSQDVRGT